MGVDQLAATGTGPAGLADKEQAGASGSGQAVGGG